MAKPTYAKLLRDLDAERNMKADVMRQRNDALGSLAQANVKIAALEARLATSNSLYRNTLARTGDIMELCTMMLQQQHP